MFNLLVWLLVSKVIVKRMKIKSLTLLVVVAFIMYLSLLFIPLFIIAFIRVKRYKDLSSADSCITLTIMFTITLMMIVYIYKYGNEDLFDFDEKREEEMRNRTRNGEEDETYSENELEQESVNSVVSKSLILDVYFLITTIFTLCMFTYPDFEMLFSYSKIQ